MIPIYDRLMFGWRTGAQVVVGAVVTWLAVRGIGLDPAVTTGLTEALYGVGVTVYAFGVHWLETRTGTSLPARAARGLARLLMLGAPPTLTYTRPEPAAVAAMRQT